MSVSDPFIKDIKGHVLKLFTESTSRKISDSSPNLQDFCQVLEKIFYKGLIENHNFYGNKKGDAYTWMSTLNANGDHLANFNYKNSLEEVRNCKSVHTSLGKFRLLIRHCLMEKCLHFPLEYLINSNKINAFYDKRSIIGDEILSAILLSVFLQCNRLSFDLELCNSFFLDSTWEIPDLVKLELVPCKNLGISISFSENKAVIVHIRPNSVASESGQIATGDVLANLNGTEINSSCKGRLNAILRSNKGRPINLILLKAFRKQDQDIFPAIKSILRNLQIDVLKIQNSQSNVSQGADASASRVSVSRNTKSGYPATYLGSVDVGKNGSVKQIEEAMKSHLRTLSGTKGKSIIFEIGEMNLKVLDLETNDIIFKHSYMQISSCGSAPNLPNYIAYIAGNESCDTASNFSTYIFHVSNVEDASTILQSIGQGFYRTHFAV